MKRYPHMINWKGLKVLYIQEVNRLFSIAGQTLVWPCINALLFLLIMAIIFKGRVESASFQGSSFLIFLYPGLISMMVIQNAFMNSSSTLVMAKITGSILDIIRPPLGSFEVLVAHIGVSMTRSFLIAFLTFLVVFFFIRAPFPVSLPIMVVACFLQGSIMGGFGFLAGMWSKSFQNMAFVSNFIIAPFSMLSGAFYSIADLPLVLQYVSYFNPFFYLIDVFRYGAIGVSDMPVAVSLVFLGVLDVVVLGFCYVAWDKGWKIRS